MRKAGLKTDVATTSQFWNGAFKTRLGCPQVNNTELWWIPEGPENDGQPNFNSYKQIGGWKTPYMKYYQAYKVCNSHAFLNYYK